MKNKIITIVDNLTKLSMVPGLNAKNLAFNPGTIDNF